MRVILLFAIAACVLVFPLSGPAAAAPPTVPMSIVSHGFETDPTAPAWSIGPVVDTVHPSTAFWGRMSNVRRTGTFSLWSAGMRANGTPNSWGNYPARTKGVARLNLPQLADFYSSEVSFFYTMPSVGAADAFSFGFRADGAQTGPWRNITGMTGANAWAQRDLKLSSAPPTELSLSRRSGHVWFQFFDFAEGPAQLPHSGQGPSIDDVAITGFKYGPVRNLSASTTDAAGVVLRWERPLRAVGSTQAEERSISHRIWRRQVGGTVWTELPRAGNAQVSYLDASAVKDVQYHYVVVATDIPPGTGYGQSAPAVVGFRPVTSVTDPHSRVFGGDRISTSIAVAHRAFPQGARNVIVTTGWDYPDALSASALAGALDGPILLVRPNSAGAAVRQAIQDLGANTVYIIGGPGAVSEAVRAELQSLAGVSVNRIQGANRFATARNVALEAHRISAQSTVFIATGHNFPDALAASSLAARGRWPILLTGAATLHPSTANALSEIRPSRVVILGGPSAVSSAVEHAIRGNPAYGSPTVIRRGGSNRYDTAKSVIDWGLSPTGGNLASAGIQRVHLATGVNFPDALAAGVLAGRGGAVWSPLMLTDPLTLSPAAASVIAGNRASHLTVIGGPGAVSLQVESAARGALVP